MLRFYALYFNKATIFSEKKSKTIMEFSFLSLKNVESSSLVKEMYVWGNTQKNKTAVRRW